MQYRVEVAKNFFTVNDEAKLVPVAHIRRGARRRPSAGELKGDSPAAGEITCPAALSEASRNIVAWNQVLAAIVPGIRRARVGNDVELLKTSATTPGSGRCRSGPTPAPIRRSRRRGTCGGARGQRQREVQARGAFRTGECGGSFDGSKGRERSPNGVGADPRNAKRITAVLFRGRR